MRRYATLLVLLAPCSLACNGYGSPQSLATKENRLTGTELVGRWECPATSPDCDGDTHEDTWLEVSRRGAELELRWKRVALRDSFTGYDSLGHRLHVDRPRDTTTTVFAANLVRVGRDTLLELTAPLPRQSFATVPVVPVYTWVRLHARRDTVRIETLDGPRLVQRLEQRPEGMRPFRILRNAAKDQTGDVIVVALGRREDVERFARRAFADPALVSDDVGLLVRGPQMPQRREQVATR